MTNDADGGARNHHFVPQYYLKGFAKPRSKDGKLTVFDLKDRKGFVTRPRNVAARRDYNRIEIEGQDPNIVESKLAELEALGDQAFRRIISARSIEDSDDFSFVHVLIARIAISNPAFRNQRDQLISQVGSMMMRNIVATPERWDAVTRQMGPELGGDPIPYEQARAAVEGGSIVANATKETLIEQEILLWPSILPILEQRKWTLLIAPPGSAGFITSDRPFSLRWNDETMNRGPYGVGLGCTDTTLIFPISHNLAVIDSFEHGGANVVDESIVAAVNFALFQAAMRQVYASADFPITDVGKVVRPFSQSEVWRRVRERPADSS
ncbi:DUF4238 domain-containing protein [Blastomonas sp. CCH5-A3]|jgi:hypothetical protein|uniref:DUF4238 domain-containing protein n=1 Tax=Blastomonas sp. CCH5-A3 TaxID=1768761 RepID=UPI00082600B8|nr:DUF4238 domain-containing protein [Blastomonas sp. CCH5-A3]